MFDFDKIVEMVSFVSLNATFICTEDVELYRKVQ
jgi:hypothetical protein